MPSSKVEGSGTVPVERERMIPARDGTPLQATSIGDSTDSVIVMAGAMAVPRRFYRRFARFMAEVGHQVITFDYRGVGARPAELRRSSARARDWAMSDLPGVLDWVHADLDPSKLFIVGHSFGGQVAGLLEDASRVDGMVTVSSQSGYWRLQGAEQKWMVLMHSYLTMPLAAASLGYLPWGWFGGANVPGGVAKEWAGWCRNPSYILGDSTLPIERYARFPAPVLAYSVEDDTWGTKRSVDAMMSAYPDLERRHLEPSRFGLETLGHMGTFRAPAHGLWREIAGWIAER